MISIATLGVTIDPTGATVGAAAVVAAAGAVVGAFRGITAAQQALAAGRGGFAAMAAAAQSTARGIASAFSRALPGIGSAVGLLARNVIADFRAIGNAVRSTAGFFSQFGLAVNGIQSFFAPLTSTIEKAFSLIKDSVGTAAMFEGLEVGMKGFLGSAEKANKMMQDLRMFSLKTPFEFPDVAKAGSVLLSLGEKAEKVIPVMQRLGDVAALSAKKAAMGGGDVTSIAALATVYSKVRNEAHLYYRDVNQLATQNVPIIESLQLVLNKSRADTLEAIHKGKVGFKEFTAAIEQMTNRGGVAFDQMRLRMDTWNQKISSLKDAWTFVEEAIGKPIIDGLKPLLDDLQSITLNLAAQIRALYPAIRQVVDYIPAAFRVMQQDGGLKLAFQAATDFLSRQLLQLWGYTKAYLGAVFDWIAGNFSAKMKVLASGEFWKGVGEMLVAGAAKALKIIGEGIYKLYSSPVQYIMDQNKAELEAVSQQKRRKDVVDEMNTIYTRQKSNYSEYGGPDSYYGGPDTLGGAARKALDDATLKDLTGELSTLNKTLNEPSASLFPTDAAGVPFKAPNYSDFATDPSAAESEFADKTKWEIFKQKAVDGVKDVWNTLAGLAQQEAMKANKDKLDILNAAEPGDKTSDKSARAAARKAEQADAALNRLRDSMLAKADPAEKYQQEMALIQKLFEAGKISAEKRMTLEEKAQEQYQLNLKKSVDATKKAAQAMETPLQKLAQEWGNLKKQGEQAAVGIAQAFASHMTSSLMDMITGAKSVKQAFSEMAMGIIKDIANITIKLLVEYAISKAIAGYRGGGAGGGGGGILGGIGMLFGIHHEGGVAGGPAPVRLMSGSTLSSARRYHTGGVAGLNPGEVPAILERGEHVMTRREASRQKRRIMGTDRPAEDSRKPHVNINLIDPRQIPAIMMEHPEATLNIINLKSTDVRRILSR